MQPFSTFHCRTLRPSRGDEIPNGESMKYKATALALVAVLFSIILMPATLANAQNTTALPSLTLTVSGTASDGSNVTGTLTVHKFASQNGKLVALGTLVAAVTDPTSGTVQNVATAVVVPVATVDPSCNILSLTLGPLHLNLLGLVVDLNQVNLTITGQTGSGNLLGNLLCSVANLLNGPGLSGALQQIVNLLNQILGAL